MLSVRGVSKSYQTAAGTLPILDGVSMELSPGDAVCILGPSGSGKSTLLFILGALEAPSAGSVSLGGEDPFAMPEAKRAAFRNRHVGFVFQDHCLLPQCSVLENVLLPSVVAPPGDHAGRARELLDRVGLGPRAAHRPAQLSGGERQRTAVARALLLSPTLLLCDEPTGNLDRKAADTVASMLLDLHAEKRTILVLVTHSLELARRFPVRLELEDGRLRPVP